MGFTFGKRRRDLNVEYEDERLRHAVFMEGASDEELVDQIRMLDIEIKRAEAAGRTDVADFWNRMRHRAYAEARRRADIYHAQKLSFGAKVAIGLGTIVAVAAGAVAGRLTAPERPASQGNLRSSKG